MLNQVKIAKFYILIRPFEGDFCFMSYNKRKIVEEISLEIKNLDYFLIDTSFRGDERNLIIEVFIDNESGITAEDCKKVSVRLNEVFQEKKLIDSNYRLDVSSPGVDRSLKFIGQFGKHLKRNFEIFFTDGDIEKKITGRLIKVNKDLLTFEINKEEIIINFSNIKKAKVLVSF